MFTLSTRTCLTFFLLFFMQNAQGFNARMYFNVFGISLYILVKKDKSLQTECELIRK